MTPNKNRLLQVRRTGGRKLFDKARKEVFLEWFAATCNVRLSSEKAGVNEKTVFKHRMNDPAFEEAWDRALRQGYARLEARTVQEGLPRVRSGDGSGEDEGIDRPSPGPSRDAGGEYAVRVLDEAEAEEHFDPQLALTLLREHARRLPGSPDKRKNQRTTARTATNREIADALAKRLKTFALRVSRENPPHPPTASRRAPPSPSKGEGSE